MKKLGNSGDKNEELPIYEKIAPVEGKDLKLNKKRYTVD